MSEKLVGLVPSICVQKAWEENGERDTSVLFNGLAGRQVGMDGQRRYLFHCLRCGVELKYDLRDNSVTGSECPQGQPETIVIDLLADTPS